MGSVFALESPSVVDRRHCDGLRFVPSIWPVWIEARRIRIDGDLLVGFDWDSHLGRGLSVQNDVVLVGVAALPDRVPPLLSLIVAPGSAAEAVALVTPVAARAPIAPSTDLLCISFIMSGSTVRGIRDNRGT
ncbi:hypothetical protein BRC94_10735 [Halobacteriales archaeon QS_5_70_17]|nr:MAG: hypothetical protein BRC94_10735 [Halobacteriales archaeon QS_5_70_17]